MLKLVVATGVAAFVALGPFAAFAATSQTAPGAHPSTHHHRQAHRPTRSYSSEMRHRSNQHKVRARAGAEHMRTMRNQ